MAKFNKKEFTPNETVLIALKQGDETKYYRVNDGDKETISDAITGDGDYDEIIALFVKYGILREQMVNLPEVYKIIDLDDY